MTKLEIINEIRTRQLEKAKILDLIKAEERELSNVEQVTMDTLEVEITEFEARKVELDKEPVKPVVKVGEDRSKNEFSLVRSIRDIVEGRNATDATIEAMDAGKKAFKDAGLSYRGNIVLPFEERADILAGTATAGQEVVAENKLGLVGALRANSVMIAAGAQLLTGLVGDISIPVFGGNSVGWKGEVAGADDGGGTFSEVPMAPKRLTGIVDVSKQFLIQDSSSANAMLMQDLALAISEKLEETLLSSGASTSTTPAGIFSGASYTSTSISWANMVAMESAIAANNALKGKLSYIFHPTTNGTLKTTSKAGTEAIFIKEGETVNGYKALATTNMPAISGGKGYVFGNFNDYVIGQWGGLDITVDPYSQAANGQVRLVVNAYFDGTKRRANSFSYGYA